MYLYQARLIRDNETRPNETVMTTEVADFENNYQSSASSIGDIHIDQTIFIVEMSWDNFKNLISTPITWGDVKYIDRGDDYMLYLVSEDEL